MSDVMLDALRAADESARTACHAAYDASVDPPALYDRVAALHGLLSKVEQLSDHLARLGDRAAELPNLYSTDGMPPAEHLTRASQQLRAAGEHAKRTRFLVSGTWTHLSPVGIREPD